MKITKIVIQPTNVYRDLSGENPLKASVQLASDDTTVETVLNGEDMEELLALTENLIARAAKRNVEQFVAAVSGRHQQTIEGTVSNE